MSNYLNVDNSKILTSITQNIGDISAKLSIINGIEIQEVVRSIDNTYITGNKLLLCYKKLSNIILVLLEYERICRMFDQRLNLLIIENPQQTTLTSATLIIVKKTLEKVTTTLISIQDVNQSISEKLYGLGIVIPELQNRLSEGISFTNGIEVESIEKIIQQNFYFKQLEYTLEVLREDIPRLLPRLRGIVRDSQGKIVFTTSSTSTQNTEIILEELKLKIQYNSN